MYCRRDTEDKIPNVRVPFGRKFIFYNTYRNNPKYRVRYAFANSVDPDQTPQNAASDQGLHCLPYI